MAEANLKKPGGRFKDLTGKVFASWTVVSYAGTNKFGQAQWVCRCLCGRTYVRSGSSISTGQSVRCSVCGGAGGDRHGHASGGTKSPEYVSWTNMKMRCNNPLHNRYQRYGGRGITVCERWNEFPNFFEDMGPKPSPKHSLDRIDNSGNYEPGNCRWATVKQQNNNRSSNRPPSEVLSMSLGFSVTASEHEYLKRRYQGGLRRMIRKLVLDHLFDE